MLGEREGGKKVWKFPHISPESFGQSHVTTACLCKSTKLAAHQETLGGLSTWYLGIVVPCNEFS